MDEDDLALVVRDAFPVSQGHTLIVPRRHVASFFSVTQEERASIVRLLDRAQVALRCDHALDGYNIGIDDGLAAGQTVPQLHIHLIPRYIGDHDDPRGGVRWVLPGKAKYWS
ncbi:MAG TPA: HIT family protein [Candidatus Accumulibacter phosphatis]|nr:MAG: AP-4-A phosphorylase [Candidatus Accumulibacter sp. SK-11]HRL77638.1 HIT family protein [Candidatus Accumulibacter phosphatis]HRQ96116.1 HIT family protein [Candidatus Accumulibacter phosphatis]